MKPFISYLICTVQRSGSTLLCEDIENTGLAGYPDESFSPLWGWENGEWARSHKITSIEEYIQLTIEQGTTPNGVFGAKILWSYFDEMIDKFREIPQYTSLSTTEILDSIFPNLHYIWLQRRDKVKQAVSWSIAAQTQIYFWSGHQTPSPERNPIFDYDHIEYLHQMAELGDAGWGDYFKQNGVQPHRVVYEDFVGHPAMTARSILEFLGVDNLDHIAQKKRTLKKLSNATNKEWVERYLDICEEKIKDFPNFLKIYGA